MSEFKQMEGIVERKEEPKVFPKKNGDGTVTIYNFWVDGLRITCFSDSIYDKINEGESIKFDYKEEVKGSYTNRTFEGFVNDSVTTLSPELLKKIEMTGKLIDETGENATGELFQKRFNEEMIKLEKEPKTTEKEKVSTTLTLNNKKYKITIEEF